jgi:AbiV family abortive infection protein
MEVSKQVPYVGVLTNVDAANAIRAARLNAIDLVDTADLLFNMKRHCHSMALSILAIEEAAKISIVIMLFLEPGPERTKLWRAYRNHRAKTEWLNPAIEGRIRATFPQIPADQAAKIGKLGPAPDELESQKQRALYSDAIDIEGKFEPHLPQRHDWRNLAWERLCEAKAMAFGLRDYPPDELAIWLKHVEAAKHNQKPIRSMLPDLHKELVDKGFVKEGWWETLLKDAEELMA